MVVGMLTADGFSQTIAGTGPAFAAFLIPHIIAGTSAVISGALVSLMRKGTRSHVRTGIFYFWALAVLAATAAGLTAVRGVRDLPVLALGVIAVALAWAGRQARRHPGGWPWRRSSGHAAHIVAMGGSYTVMLTAFMTDNSKFLPLLDRLPIEVSLGLPAVAGVPLIALSVRRHRRPKRAAPRAEKLLAGADGSTIGRGL